MKPAPGTMTGKTQVVTAPPAQAGTLRATLSAAKASQGVVGKPRGRKRQKGVNARAQVAGKSSAPVAGRGKPRAGGPPQGSTPGSY